MISPCQDFLSIKGGGWQDFKSLVVIKIVCDHFKISHTLSPSCMLMSWRSHSWVKNISENMVWLSGQLDSCHYHVISCYAMAISSFFLPHHLITGFEYSAFKDWLSWERKWMLSWGLFVCLSVTSPSKECLELLGPFNPRWKWLEAKEFDHLYFVRKYVWLEGNRHSNRSLIWF